MIRNIVKVFFVVAAIALVNAAGLIPPQLAAAAGVLGDDAQRWVIDQVGSERVYLYLVDQAIDKAQKELHALLQDWATKRVDHDLAKDKLAEAREAEIDQRAILAELGVLLQANRTVKLGNGDIWSPSRIKESATREVARHKILLEQVTIYEETVQRYADAEGLAEAALVALQQDLENVQAQHNVLRAIVEQGVLLEGQPNRPPEVTATLTKTQSDIQSLIDSRRRVIRIAQEMSNLSLPVVTSAPLVEQQDQALLDYINDVTSLVAGR